MTPMTQAMPTPTTTDSIQDAQVLASLAAWREDATNTAAAQRSLNAWLRSQRPTGGAR